MPKINISVDHKLTYKEAMRRTTSLLGEVKTKFADKIDNLKEEWVASVGTFSFTVMGFSVSGAISVCSGCVNIVCNIPIAIYPFKSKIESTIIEQAKNILS